MYRGPIVDLDVHHRWKRPEDLLPYLPARWRDFATSGGGGDMQPLNPGRLTYPHLNGTHARLDAFAEDGSPPGSDYETMRDQLLDPLKITRAMLKFEIGMQGGMENPYWAAALCRAINDWNLEHWLSRDDRLYGGILVPAELPFEAAAEIERLAGHPKLAEVLLVANPIGKPFGHPLYDPIFAAAEEAGLPIAAHLGGETIGKGRECAGGHPQTILEHMAVVNQPAMHYVIAMIQHGVFEKFPKLKFMLVEFGFTWVPPLLWRLDSLYSTMRRESDWVKRLPSEYFRDHVRVTTQPVEHMPPAAFDALAAFEGIEDLLCFATDYPHWDTEGPAQVVKTFPESWLPKLFAGNAAAALGWADCLH